MAQEKYMRRALELAALAASEGEVPVGCVIVRGGEVIAEGRNRRETLNNALHHAEIEAIDAACKALHSRRLAGCELYVTLEPCMMCAGAIMNAQIDSVVYGARDANMGACGGVINIFEEPFGFHPRMQGGFMETEACALLRDFFIKLR